MAARRITASWRKDGAHGKRHQLRSVLYERRALRVDEDAGVDQAGLAAGAQTRQHRRLGVTETSRRCGCENASAAHLPASSAARRAVASLTTSGRRAWNGARLRASYSP
jgi:hypothetical protein